jgi:O-antigen/teichoic acid export membrane protein
MWQAEIPELDRRGLRQFAFTTAAAVAFLFGVALPWLFERPRPTWPWAAAAVLAVWGALAPSTLRTVYRGWMWLGVNLSKATTPVVLGVLFFLVILPIGITRRRIWGDGLSRELDRAASTYRLPTKKAARDDLARPY